jgi:branched-chain amino acid transport system substrate-binding protein
MLRRTFVASSVLAAVAAVLPWSSQAQPEPIRIGFLTVRSGALAAGGKQMEEGIQLFLKERNNTIAGRKVELIIADTAGNPAQAKTKVQELVERSKVHVIVGPLAAFEAIAIDDYYPPDAHARRCRARRRRRTSRSASPIPWFVRTVGTSAQPNHALGRVRGEDPRLQARRDHRRRFRLRARDRRPASSVPSRTTAARWCSGCCRRSTFPTTAPISRRSSATWTRCTPGSPAPTASASCGQYREYGLKLPVLGSMTTADEASCARWATKRSAWSRAAGTRPASISPENKRFVAAVNKEYGADPGLLHPRRLLGGALVEAAARAVGGKVERRTRS